MALPGTPRVEGYTQELLTQYPNLLNPQNGAVGTNPFRLDGSEAATADQSHAYLVEQQAFHGSRWLYFPRLFGIRTAAGFQVTTLEC